MTINSYYLTTSLLARRKAFQLLKNAIEMIYIIVIAVSEYCHIIHFPFYVDR